MIKRIAPAQRHPTNRSLPAFHNYWGESHGPLFANTKILRRYVQHLTLPAAYGGHPAPTYDGVSMFWYDDLESQRVVTRDPRLLTLRQNVLGVALDEDNLQAEDAEPDDPAAEALLLAVLEDDSQLFDRSTTWPMHQKRASVVAREHVIVDGQTTPEMVKAIFIVSKLPGLTLDEFCNRWRHHHGPLVANVPGLRRYVQNHAIPEAYAGRGHTHDGWSELWFDNLAALHSAAESAEWQTLRKDGATLFAQPQGVGIARERVQKEIGWTYHDWGVNALSENEVRERLAGQGYATLAADPDAPRTIKSAASAQALAVWTAEHLATIDDSRIDARPDR